MRAQCGWTALALLTAGLLATAPPMGAQEADLDGLGFTLGDPEAPIHVVEYADFACGACATFAVSTFPAVVEEFVEAGLVYWRMVPFELGFPNSEPGARAAHCAAEQDGFWAMHGLLYEGRSEWVEERRPRPVFQAMAGEAGLDGEALDACYDDNDARDQRRRANRAARTDGVRGTPTFFIDGFRVQGALPMDAFRALLRERG